jgi:hypothetical protein
MAKNQYPITVLVYGDGHWIVVIGVTTDLDPNTSSSVVLQKIEANDPWQAQHVLVSGSTWLQKYWYSPAKARGKWDGCYVAIREISTLEERDFELRFQASEPQTTLITPRQALRKAKKHLAQQIAENASFSELAKESFLEPRLVNHPSGLYYLIPLGSPVTHLSSGAMMLNAYSGEWEGMSHFKEKVRYLDVKHLPRGKWIFSPSKESPSPFFPAYEVEAEVFGSPVYLNQDGKMTHELHALQPGS